MPKNRDKPEHSEFLMKSAEQLQYRLNQITDNRNRVAGKARFRLRLFAINRFSYSLDVGKQVGIINVLIDG